MPRDMRSPSRMPSCLFVLAVLPFGLGIWGCYQGWRTLNWPTTDAKILGSDQRRFETERRDGNRAVTDVRHAVDIRYSYSVGGREYVGEDIQPYSYGMQNSAAAWEQFERYRPDTTARVAYNPADARDAYLEPGPSSVSKMLLAVGAILALAGFWVRSIAKRGAKMHA